jgi:hypothetical protein
MPPWISAVSAAASLILGEDFAVRITAAILESLVDSAPTRMFALATR